MDIVRRLLPNIVTFARITLTIILNVYITREYGSLVFPLVVFIIILLTDYYDGKIARHLNANSKFGAIFDILTDLFFILLTYINMSIHGILPLWFVYIIVYKFSEFIITSFAYKKVNSKLTKVTFTNVGASYEKSMFLFDALGKFTVALFYIMPMYAYLTSILSEAFYSKTIGYLICVASFCAIISSVYRIKRCIVSGYKIRESIFGAEL